MDDLKSIIGKVATGATLSRDESAQAFDRMMSGEATPSQMGGLLMALRVRGETVDEITGAVRTMRSKMLAVEAPADALAALGVRIDLSPDAISYCIRENGTGFMVTYTHPPATLHRGATPVGLH